MADVHKKGDSNGEAEAENHQVNQSDNLKDTDDNEANQSALTRNARRITIGYFL